jgi:hypothetical protein
MRQQAFFRTSWLNILFQAVFLALRLRPRNFRFPQGRWRLENRSNMVPCFASLRRLGQVPTKSQHCGWPPG